MFSSDMGKIIELQGQYIDRVNRNAAKLNKQLQFLVNIGEQIGGATTQGETNDHTTLIGELTKQDEAIATAMTAQKTKTDELKNSIERIIKSYAILQTSSGSSNTKVDALMDYLIKLKDTNAERLNDLSGVNEKLNNNEIKEALKKATAIDDKTNANPSSTDVVTGTKTASPSGSKPSAIAPKK